MYLPGHVGLALLAAAALVAVVGTGRRVAVAAALLVLFASAPDVDLYVAALSHRGITHTVWAALGLGGAFALVASGARDVRLRSAPPFWAGVGASSVLLHLLGDVITPMGVSPLRPLVATHVTLDLVAARNPTANLALLACGVLAMLVALDLREPRVRRLRSRTLDRALGALGPRPSRAEGPRD